MVARAFAIVSGSAELTTCDGSVCRRQNAPKVKMHEPRSELLSAAVVRTDYRVHAQTARHRFCSVCGI